MFTLSPAGRIAVVARKADWFVCGVVVGGVMKAYLDTLYPGLGGGGDAAKFRFLGHVLGTAHPSGYPLYTLVSYLFSLLPFGTLAYRINLMSAVFGALAAAATFVSVRSLGGGRAAAAAAALGLAFGRMFWSKAVVAEVYTLAGCLAAAALMALLKWRQTGRPSWLLGAVAFTALAFGNHLSVMFAVPAFIAFALVTDARTCLRPRILLGVAMLVAVGLAQYAFIILRTYQHAPFLESKATNLTELWTVITARRYASDIGAFSWTQLWQVRLPGVFWLFRAEVGPVGLWLMAAGAGALLRWRWREALLIIGALMGVVAVTLSVDADSEGFLVPGFVCAWILAGAGLQAIVTAAGEGFRRRAAVVGSLLLAVAVPVLQVSSNRAPNDHSRRTYEDTYLTALFNVLPDKTIIPTEEYAIDQLVNYQLLGAEAARGRDIRLMVIDPPLILSEIDRGYGVYAFPRARKVLEQYGLAFAPVQLTGLVHGAPVPIDMTPLPIARMTFAGKCEAVGNAGWRDVGAELVSGHAAARIDNYRAFDATFDLWLASVEPLSPHVSSTSGTGLPAVAIERFDGGDRAAAVQLADRLRADGLADRPWRSGTRFAYRIRIAVNDQGDFSTTLLAFGGRASAGLARARVDLDNPRRATLCSAPAPDLP